ncbi:Sulfotransferase family protein [Pseudovibrio sp. Ad26]|nr:Sulfotransferase family protein [Pseudovibrio sp. Ad26]
MPCIFLNKHKLLFIHIPKTGGRYITERFKENQGLLGGVEHFGCSTHISLRKLQVHKNFLEREIQDYEAFCVVRNPWDQAVSMHKFVRTAVRRRVKDRLLGKEVKRDTSLLGDLNILRQRYLCSFDYNVKERIRYQRLKEKGTLPRQQLDWVKSDQCVKTHVLRFESFLEDIKALPREVAHCLNGFVSKPQPYHDWFSPKLAGIIEQAYKPDIEALGYKF